MLERKKKIRGLKITHQPPFLRNFTASFDFVGDKWGLDLMILNASDEDGVNSSMTDVFGVAATGIELIPPRQIMARLSMNY